MKKGLYASLLCALLLSVLLAGCVRLTIDPSPQELMGFQEDVLAAYDEAARLYDWFDLAPMPLDESDSVREGESTYFRVLDETITSTKELRSRLERVFTSELAEEIFNKAPDQYRDFDGKLYAIPGGRGTNLYLLDKTVQAERLSEDRWEVTLTFWADYEDARMVPETGVSASYPTAVTGYCTTSIYYERTSEGWRFTSFCPTDNLDLDAETVCSSDYYEGFRTDCSDWELVCYLIHADGAFAEGAFYRLYQRFLERPNDILSCLALLDSSPYAAAYPHIDSLIADPGYQAAYEEEGRLAFEETVKLCVPANEAEEIVLKKIQGAYTSLRREEQAWTDLQNLRFSFTVPNTAVFILGPQECAFPWGLALDAEPVLVSPAMDGFGPCYEATLDAVTLEYTVNPDDGTEVLYKMTTNDPHVSTDSGISVGDALEQVKERYPDCVPLDAYPDSGVVYVWEPGGPAYCKHIAFFTQDDVVTGIEIENLMDGRLLE